MVLRHSSDTCTRPAGLPFASFRSSHCALCDQLSDSPSLLFLSSRSDRRSLVWLPISSSPPLPSALSHTLTSRDSGADANANVTPSLRDTYTHTHTHGTVSTGLAGTQRDYADG